MGRVGVKQCLILVHGPRDTVVKECRASRDNSLATAFHCPIRRRRSRLVASKVDARRRIAYSHADMPDPPRWPECPAWPLQLRLCSRCSIPQSPSTTTYRREGGLHAFFGLSSTRECLCRSADPVRQIGRAHV